MELNVQGPYTDKKEGKGIDLTLIFNKLRIHIVISVVTNKRVHNFQTRRWKNGILKINNNITDKNNKTDKKKVGGNSRRMFVFHSRQLLNKLQKNFKRR